MSLKSYLFLIAAVVAEVIATTALAQSASFTRLVPSVVVVVAYSVSFWLLSFPLRTMPTGIVYALWSGMGIILITAIAWLWRGQALDLPAVVGLGLIVAGVIVINVFSKSVGH